jgi:L-threonylcarbamoyladenylate synthase
LKGLQGRIDLVLDGGPTTGGLESTVLDLTAQPPRILRPGLITPAQLEAVLGPIEWHTDTNKPETPSLPLASPGLLPRHYAPQAKLECVVGNGRPRVEQLRQQEVPVGWLALCHSGEPLDDVVLICMPDDPVGYSAQLYAALHTLDEAGVERIVVELPPSTDAWLAVHDRLRRASAGDS